MRCNRRRQVFFESLGEPAGHRHLRRALGDKGFHKLGDLQTRLLHQVPGIEVYGIRSTGDRARDQAAIAQLLSPRGRPARGGI